MLKNTLIILDIEKNYDLNEKNIKFISLNKGLINLYNCKQIYLNKFYKEKKKIYKNFLSIILKTISSNKNHQIPLIELEINNLRNDRYNFIDRIINLATLKKIIFKQGFTNIKIISDNKTTLNIFNNLKINLDKIDLSKKKKIDFIKLKLLKFYIKALIIVVFLKLKKINHLPKKNTELFFSISPNKFNYNKKKLNNDFLLNFLLTDETHLNHNIFKIFNIIKNQKNTKTINVESFISIRHLVFLIFKIFCLKKNYNSYLKKFMIEELDFTNEIKPFYIKSFLNRSKLQIYDKAIFFLLKKFQIKIFHMYLFEYSFGFYLINKIKNFSKKIQIIGYQHGIFSENLLWLDVLGKFKKKNYYIPDKILASNKYSANAYKKKLGQVNVNVLKSDMQKENILVDKIKIEKNSNNIIVFPGTHDVKDLYYFFKNNKNFKKKIFFKLHPKNRFFFKDIQNISKLENYRIKEFSKIIISQTSSLIYDFLLVKKIFFVIDIDYKFNLFNKKVLPENRFISRNKQHDKTITFKV